MAVIVFHTSHRTERIQARLQAVLAVLHDKLDAFVDHRIRLAAARAGRVRHGQFHDTPQSRRPAAVTAEFWAIDPGIVSEAIPAFFIGRNIEGFWVARDVKGRIGGIFLLESSATSFARRNSGPAGCATIHPSERFELDLENNGNPLVAPLASLMRVALRANRRKGRLT